MDLMNFIKELTLGPGFFKEALKEKRTMPRIVCSIKAYAKVRGRRHIFKITDVGLKGVKVETYVKLPKDLTFRLTVDTETGVLQYGGFTKDTLVVQVAWCRKQRFTDAYNAGLLLIDNEANIRSSWVYHIFKEMGVDQDTILKKRESYRIPIELPVTCVTRGNERIGGIILNLGLGGILMRSDDDIPKGTEAQISIGPFKENKAICVQGKVVRSSYVDVSYTYHMGIEFTEVAPKEYLAIGRLILKILRERQEKV